MQVLVEIPSDVSDGLQKMADAEQIPVEEMLARIARQAVFVTAPNLPLVNIGSDAGKKTGRSFLELDGLGAEIWRGIDAQEYVNELRHEWDERP